MLAPNNQTNPELAYCNFTNRLFDPEIQLNYGPLELKKENVWFEVIKDDHNSYSSTELKIGFSKVNINIGKAISTSTKQFIAPMEGWYQFFTSGEAYYYNSYIRIRTLRDNTVIEDERLDRGGYGSNTDMILTTMFTRKLKINDTIEIRQKGYKFPSHNPFRFMGFSVPKE